MVKLMANNLEPKLADGAVFFQVVTARKMTSRQGYEMLKVGLHCIDKNGTKRYIPDYIVFGPTTEWKIKSFLQSIGKEKHNINGKNIYKVKGKTGQAIIRKMKIHRYLNNKILFNRKKEDSNVIL